MMLVEVEADVACDVSAKVLDLLSADGALPDGFHLHREGAELRLKLSFAAAQFARAVGALRSVERLPGVRSVAAAAIS